MKRKMLTGLLSGAVLGSSVVGLCAEVKDNPYQSILARNAFALKSPPPPTPATPPDAPPSPVDVVLTGITTLGGSKKALLQITDKSPGKNKTEYPPPLEEKDVQDRIEVVTIDPEKGEVLIKIDGNEKKLSFKDTPKPSTPTAPVAPPNPFAPGGGLPMFPPGAIPAPATAAFQSAAGKYGSGNVAVGGNTSGAGNVAMGGAAATSVPAPVTGLGSYSPASSAGNVSVGGGGISAVSASPTIPPRPLRASFDGSGNVTLGGAGGVAPAASAAQPPPQPSMTREQAIAFINEQKRLRAEAENLGLIRRDTFPPLPPTPGWPPQGTTPTPTPAPPH